MVVGPEDPYDGLEKRISWHFGPWNSDIRGMNQAAIILWKPCYSKEDKAIFQLYNRINKKWSDIFCIFFGGFAGANKPGKYCHLTTGNHGTYLKD